jgi:hypothetical protein
MLVSANKDEPMLLAWLKVLLNHFNHWSAMDLDQWFGKGSAALGELFSFASHRDNDIKH